jgi:microcystin-dependent protein
MQDIIINFVASEIGKIPSQLGQIMTYTGDDIPDGFLPCDDRMLRRKNYPDLFKAIKTKYGDADGSNTAFNLPLMTSATQGIHYIICVKSPEHKDT